MLQIYTFPKFNPNIYQEKRYILAKKYKFDWLLQ